MTPIGAATRASNRDPRERAMGLGAVAIATTAFSWGFIIAKALPLSPGGVAFWRLLIGAVTLTGVALAVRSRLRAPPIAMIVAGVAFGLHQLLYIAATKTTSIAIVTLIGAALPLLVAVVSRRAVGEPVARALIGWSVLALAGIGVVVQANLGDPSRSLLGDLLAVLNVLVFAAYFLAAKRARLAGAPTVAFTATVFWIALILVVPATLLAGDAAPSGAQIGLLALLALVPGNGHLLVNWAHRRVSAALTSLVMGASPLLAALWAHLVFDEPLTWRHLLGIAIVIAAIEGGRRADSRSPEVA